MDNLMSEENLNQGFISYDYLMNMNFKELKDQLPKLLKQLKKEVFLECIENLLKNLECFPIILYSLRLYTSLYNK